MKLTLLKNITLAVGALVLSFSAWALTLQEAKDQALVGELRNGYVGIAVNSADVSALVDEINQKRKAAYEQIADSNNLTLEQVEQRAGVKNLERTASGHLIENASGQLVVKP
jgi:hypothetical protein